MITVVGDGPHAAILRAAGQVALALPPARRIATPRGPENRVPAVVEQAIAAMIGGVPGCTFVSVTRRPRLAIQRRQSSTGPTISHLDGPYDLEVAVDGWSPSLHALAMQWILVDLESGPRRPHSSAHGGELGRDDLDWVVHALRPMVAVQAQRAHSAAAIGIARPLDVAGGIARTDHLTADRSALALAASVHGDGLRNVLGAAVARLHREAIDQATGPHLHGPGCRVTDELGTQHLAWLTTIPRNWNGTLPDDAPGRSTTLFDDVLTIHGETVPDTVLAALAGRRVDALARIHPLLDARGIASAEAAGINEPTIMLRLVPERVRIEDY